MLSSRIVSSNSPTDQAAYTAGLTVSHARHYGEGAIIPLGISVPLPQGISRSIDQWVLRDIHGNELLFQPSILQRWHDGSIRWCRLEWLHTPLVGFVHEHLTVEIHPLGDSTRNANSPESTSTHSLSTKSSLAFRVRLVDEDDCVWISESATWNVLEAGPVFQKLHQVVQLRSDSGRNSPIEITCSNKFYPAIDSAVYRLRVRNPRSAEHPGGTWDLGNGGSFLIKDLSIEYSVPPSAKPSESWVQIAPDREIQTSRGAIEIFQASSGGDHWDSRNHIDRFGKIPMPFRGYECRIDETRLRGDRAIPRLGVGNQEHQLVFCMRDYWENFPKSVRQSDHRLSLGLFPEQSGTYHELQGGEQKTHQWAVCCDPRQGREALAWYHTPSFVTLNPETYARAQGVRYLTPRAEDPNQDYLALVDGAIEGEDTFLTKRETIDEYGWRNFGDLYGDHEAVFGDPGRPLISHYNNQYDCVGGFAIQFLRSGRKDWWDQMIAMADHAWDIDTYHTERDKNLYNGGLFWHTYHYADADSATHRSYPSSLSSAGKMPGGKDLAELGRTGKRLAKVYAIGGGPSASNNYPTGWMYAYWLSGETDYREAAILAAHYVQRIEDGTKTVFRWLSGSDTGLSIESGPGYHGPGRASGNSLHALLTGYELTDDASYLDSAEQLIQRVVHPDENIQRLDLTNAELRWFYTMFLQALMRYIDIKAERGMNDYCYAYAWASLVHYARWILANESPTLDNPERLQYPTETWAAQDMRKWHILQYAAWLDPGTAEQKARFQAKADFFFDYVCRTLSSMPSHRLCRPTVLMMQFGWQRAWFQSSRDRAKHPRPVWDQGFPGRKRFVPQRTLAIQRAKMLAVASAVVAVGLLVIVAAAFLR